MSDAVITLNHLEKSFGENAVLRDINLTVNRGEVISVIGSSGSGKSTMLRCINLLEEPTGGEILYEGKNILDKSLKLTEYRAKVAMVFQQFNLFNNMTALDNCVKPQTVVLKRTKEEATQIALEFIEKVGMSAYINALFHKCRAYERACGNQRRGKSSGEVTAACLILISVILVFRAKISVRGTRSILIFRIIGRRMARILYYYSYRSALGVSVFDSR